tara:strand:- start:1420 stop:2289 length:870 start_codon:yes stop_codon:yes gene_type:complete
MVVALESTALAPTCLLATDQVVMPTVDRIRPTDARHGEAPEDARAMQGDLPPLVFNGGEAYDVRHPLQIEYKIDSSKVRSGRKNRIQWPTGLCGCCYMDEIGLNCCLAHTLCQPCTWAGAAKVAGVPEATTAAFTRIVASLIPRDSQANKLLGGYVDGAASFAGARVRRKINEKLYGMEGVSMSVRPGDDTSIVRERFFNEESFWSTLFVHCCCVPCAYCQETNAVIVWARELEGQKGTNAVTYGDVLRCQCCYMVEKYDRSRQVCSLPFAPTGEPAPNVQTMRREKKG